MAEKNVDTRKLLHLLAISKYPVKLKALDTLYIEPSPVLKVKSWVHTNPAGYLTVKRNQQILKHTETIKAFILQCLARSVPTHCFLADV